MTAASNAPINALVERLRSDSGVWVPKVSRHHGGVAAPILSVLQDPGKGTNHSGVLSTDNDDPTSKVQRDLMERTGLVKRDLCPWNAYPWANDQAVEGDLTPERVARGAVVLREVIAMMTGLRVLLLQGQQARWAWGMIQAFTPELADPSFAVIRTFHPLGPRGNPARLEQQLSDWQWAAAVSREAQP